MDMRLLPKLLLWIMLTISCLGTIASFVQPEQDLSATWLQQSLQQQVAVETAAGFTREWMSWNGDELPEVRQVRLKPYVSPDKLAQVVPVQTEQKTNRQQVLSTELLSLSGNGAHFTVRLRVIVANPSRVLWEAEVQVWMQTGQGAAVTAPPLLRLPQTPPAVPDSGTGGETVSSEVKQQMRPAIESFLKAMCESKEKSSLLNYVSASANLTPLSGRLHFLSLEQLEATGTGPYTVKVTFSVQEETTGFRVTQIWRLAVIEENGKYFVGGVSS
ncbi:conjugal transfer protein [Paenibacillus sp. S150]|nr:conjugal transfer protein [Paenibacillus sp. S150]